MKSIFLSILFVVFAGCQSSVSESALKPLPDFHSDKVGTKQSVQEVYEAISFYGPIGAEKDSSHPNYQARPSAVGAEALLPKIHSWLRPGRGLQRTKINGDDVLILRALPTEVVDAISTVTFDDQNPSGFLILQASFWRFAQAQMAKGLTIGFFDYDSNDRVNGMYLDQSKTILVDLISNQGTLIHESRHHDQYNALQQHQGHRATSMSQACVEAASRFFGELDATTTELPSWTGAFQSVEAHPVVDATNSNPLDVSHSLLDIMNANLGYPAYAETMWFSPVDTSEHCPLELKEGMLKIIEFTERLSSDARSIVLDLLGIWSSDIYTQAIAKANQCDGSKASPECVRCESKYTDDLKSAESAKTALDGLFVHAREDRITAIKQALAPLPVDVATDLCYGALGFESYYNCKMILKGAH